MASNAIATGHQGAWQALIKKSFQYNKGVRNGQPDVIVTNGAPTSITAPIGLLAWDVTNSDGYICTVADTTWVKINA